MESAPTSLVSDLDQAVVSVCLVCVSAAVSAATLCLLLCLSPAIQRLLYWVCYAFVLSLYSVICDRSLFTLSFVTC